MRDKTSQLKNKTKMINLKKKIRKLKLYFNPNEI